MIKKQRFKLGFTFGKFEHRTREIGYVFLALTTVALWLTWYSLALVLCIIALILESVSYVAHRLEKMTMDSIRFGKRN